MGAYWFHTDDALPPIGRYVLARYDGGTGVQMIKTALDMLLFAGLGRK